MIQCQLSLADFPRVLHRRVPGVYVTLSVTVPLHDNNIQMDIQDQKKIWCKRNILIDVRNEVVAVVNFVYHVRYCHRLCENISIEDT